MAKTKAKKKVTRKKTARAAKKATKKIASKKKTAKKAAKKPPRKVKAAKKAALPKAAVKPKRPRRTMPAVPPPAPAAATEVYAPPPATTPPPISQPAAPSAFGEVVDVSESGAAGEEAAEEPHIRPKPGDRAPEFELPDETGRTQSLSQYRGKTVVLYFYPRDDTPGCTTEACGFRDALGAFSARQAVVLGISADSVASHRRFAQKYGLTFPLLSDAGYQVAGRYGVLVTKTGPGGSSTRIARTTFLIGPDGCIQHVFSHVQPAGHPQEVLGRLS